MLDKPVSGEFNLANTAEIHHWARLYAALGFRVFPCLPDRKEPACGWKNEATTDLTTIDRWWAENPNYNVGIATGDIGVIDLDVKMVDGIGNWNKLSFDQGTPPGSPLTAKTGSGGRHLYQLNPAKVGCSVAKIGPGIDFRGVGGYVVAPPSVVAGKSYEWLFGGEDIELGFLPALPDVPAWEVEACNTKRVAPRKRPDEPTEWDREADVKEAIRRINSDLKRNGAPVEGAGSDEQAYKLAAWLGDLPLSLETIIALMCERWAPHFDPDWIADKVMHGCDPENGYRQNDRGVDPQQTGQEKFGKLAENASAFKQAAGVTDEASGGLRLIRGDAIEPKEVEWIWPGHLAAGKLHIHAGTKGDGKTTVDIDLAATITSGGNWPDGTPAEQGDVVFWSGEDDNEDVLLPRFLAAGGDRKHIHFIGEVDDSGETRDFDPAIDMPRLMATAAALPNLKLIVLDPIVQVATGDGNNNAETRRALRPVIALGRRRKAAIIGITHFNKNSAKVTPLDRLNGSLAWGAVSRMVEATMTPEDGGPRRFVRVASNIAPKGDGFAYEIVTDTPVPGYGMTATTVRWLGPIKGTPMALLGAEPKPMGRPSAVRDEAAGWLDEYLRQAGEYGVDSEDVKKAADANGHSWSTIKRAKSALPISVRQNPGAQSGGWVWRWVEPEIPL